ncbi:hypothetical protein KIPB_009410, partial [Kipferlia bialata]
DSTSSPELCSLPPVPYVLCKGAARVFDLLDYFNAPDVDLLGALGVVSLTLEMCFLSLPLLTFLGVDSFDKRRLYTRGRAELLVVSVLFSPLQMLLTEGMSSLCVVGVGMAVNTTLALCCDNIGVAAVLATLAAHSDPFLVYFLLPVCIRSLALSVYRRSLKPLAKALSAICVTGLLVQLSVAALTPSVPLSEGLTVLPPLSVYLLPTSLPYLELPRWILVTAAIPFLLPSMYPLLRQADIAPHVAVYSCCAAALGGFLTLARDGASILSTNMVLSLASCREAFTPAASQVLAALVYAPELVRGHRHVLPMLVLSVLYLSATRAMSQLSRATHYRRPLTLNTAINRTVQTTFLATAVISVGMAVVAQKLIGAGPLVSVLVWVRRLASAGYLLALYAYVSQRAWTSSDTV